MSEPLTRLYPGPTEEVALENLYLDLDLRGHEPLGRAFLYSTFITSVDGRVSLAAESDRPQEVPAAITNPRDWRLFQELAIQADVLITSGRYVRQLAEGKATKIITIYDDATMRDLRSWRRERGLADHPAVAVVSHALDFDPSVLDGEVLVVTDEEADPALVAAYERQGIRALRGGGRRVEGRSLAEQLERLGLRTAFSAAGPRILRMLVAGGVLDRLFVTVAGRILGGTDYTTMVEGPTLSPPGSMRLESVYFDPEALGGAGQVLMAYAAQGDG